MGAVIFGFFAVVFGLLLGAGILSAATAMAGIEGRSFGKALGATVLAAIAGIVVAIPLGVLGIGDGLIEAVAGLIANLAVIRGVYATTWGKAFLAWILQVVVVLILLVPFIALGGVAALLG